MTDEDLKQIREIVAESEARMRANQDRAAESLITSMGDLRTELVTSVNTLRKELTTRMDALERRLDRIADNTTALTRWADRLDKDNLQMTSTQAAQQRAIDQLAAEVAEIKRRLQQRPEA